MGRGYRILPQGHRNRLQKPVDPLPPRHCPEHKNQWDDTISAYRKAIEINPKFAGAYYGLGFALVSKKQWDDAIAAYRKAIEVQPTYAEAHCNLGDALRHQGRFAESLDSYRRGHELGRQRPNWPYPSAEWVRQGERLADLVENCRNAQAGEYQPQNNDERLGLARVCQLKQLHRARPVCSPKIRRRSGTG